MTKHRAVTFNDLGGIATAAQLDEQKNNPAKFAEWKAVRDEIGGGAALTYSGDPFYGAKWYLLWTMFTSCVRGKYPCPDGYEKTEDNRCVRKVPPQEQCNNLIAKTIQFMESYQRDPRNKSHKKIAELSAKQARRLGCDQNKINQALRTGGGGGATTTVAQIHVKTPSSCYDPGMKIIHKLIDPPPWAGISPICQDRYGKRWLQTANRVHPINPHARDRAQRRMKMGCLQKEGESR